MLWRIQTAVKPETRARRIAQLVEMLARGEVVHIFKPKPKQADGEHQAKSYLPPRSSARWYAGRACARASQSSMRGVSGAEPGARVGGLDREAHLDVGRAELRAGEPRAAGQVGLHEGHLAIAGSDR